MTDNESIDKNSIRDDAQKYVTINGKLIPLFDFNPICGNLRARYANSTHKNILSTDKPT